MLQAEENILEIILAMISVGKIPLDKDNRMLRFGFGKNEGRWFVRIDLWFAGFRLTRL
jgi:hypothetical protein